MGSLNGTNGTSQYSVPGEAKKLFYEALLENTLISKYLPFETLELASKIHFSGDGKSSVPVNWRIAESAAALHALEATLVGILLEKRYGKKHQVWR